MRETPFPTEINSLTDKDLAEDVARASNCEHGARAYHKTIPPLKAEAERVGDTKQVESWKREEDRLKDEAMSEEALRIDVAQEIAAIPQSELQELRNETEDKMNSAVKRLRQILPENLGRQVDELRKLDYKIWAIDRRLKEGQ